MTYPFPPDLAEGIKERMASGQYSTEDDLHALRWRDQEAVAIQEGIDDMEADRLKPLREFDREFRERNNISEDA